MWFFERYQRLSQRERALTDGRLITYHFYVAGITLIVLGLYGWHDGARFSFVAVVFGAVSLALGAGLHVFHRRMVESPQRDAYLATLTAALGRYAYPLVPSLLAFLILFSILVTILYIIAG